MDVINFTLNILTSIDLRSGTQMFILFDLKRLSPFQKRDHTETGPYLTFLSKTLMEHTCDTRFTNRLIYFVQCGRCSKFLN